MVGWVSPKAGVERLRARAMLSVLGGYTGGRRDRRATRNWRPREESANADILPDLPDLRARSRDLIRNMPIATGAVATAVTNIVGDGMKLQSTIDRKALGLSDEEANAWQDAAEAEFDLFCKTADFTRAQHFADLQGLIFRGVLESGDSVVLRRYRKDAGDTYGLKLQVVEADRLCNENRAADQPGQIAGKTFDNDGVVTGFHIADRHPDDRLLSTTALSWSKIPARDQSSGRPLVLHLFDRLRPDQARGVPYLAPVIEAFKTLNDFTEAELRAAVVSALLTVFVTRPDADSDAAPTIVGEQNGSTASNEVELGSGAIIDLAPGEKAEIVNPGRPNPQFDPFVTAILRQIGVALELPFEMLVKHFTASYSASRAALEMAWQFFDRRRKWLARELCQPVYEWFLEESVARGRLVAPGFFDDPIIRQAYSRATWIGAPRISLDPKKDAEANEINLRNRTVTRDALIMQSSGGDFETTHAQLVKEEQAWVATGLASPPPVQAAPDPPSPDNPIEG